MFLKGDKKHISRTENPQNTLSSTKVKNATSHLSITQYPQWVKASSRGIHRKQISQNALITLDKLQARGYQAYIVGGCLRDLILQKQPKDFDIATNATPEQIQQIFTRQCRLIGRRFRLAHILFGREIIEVATFRANHDGVAKHLEHIAKQNAKGLIVRDNVYGTLEQDAQRRDFTINALYYDPNKDKMYDPFNGFEHLRHGKLQLIGDPTQRYQEDPVRMLRAIRFIAKLDLFLDEQTEKPIRKSAHLLRQIPKARLFDESLKLLQTGNGVKTYELMLKYDLFFQLFPSLKPFFTPEGDTHTQRMIKQVLRSTDERIKDRLRINPAFLFSAFFWYPLREQIERLHSEGGLTYHDAYLLGSNEVLVQLCRGLSVPRRHTAVIRDIWALQNQLLKRRGKRPFITLEHPKFRAGFDLLAMRAEVEGGEAIELTAWWHAMQLSNQAQRGHLIEEFMKSSPTSRSYRKKHRYYRPPGKNRTTKARQS